MTPTPVLVARDLHRSFGDRQVVCEVSFTIHPGQVVGLVGPNGAGKTTTVRMCSTLLAPTSGEITICGVDAVRHRREARRHLGIVLGGETGFYNRASVRDNLLFFADVAGVPGNQRHHQVAASLARVGLEDRATSPVQELSRGMKQRLHIARGILANPTVLMLDEPTNGLDPEIAATIRSLIRELTAEGIGILITTHLLTEMEELADQIHVLIGGRIVASGGAAAIASKAGIDTVSNFSTPLGVEEPLTCLLEQLRAHPSVARVAHQAMDARHQVTISWAGAPENLSAMAEAHGLMLDDLGHRRPSLEESYLALVGGA